MNSWKTSLLGDVASIERSSIQPEEIKSGTSYVGLEHIEPSGLLKAKPIDAGILASSKFCFTSGHVLYGKLRPYLAKIACPDFSGICSTDIVPILPGPKLDRRYLFHFLRQPSMVSYATSRAVGVNLPRLSPSVLEQFPLPLPRLTEQRRIAAILDKAEELRAKRRATVAQLATLSEATFLDLFGDPATNSKGWPDGKRLGEVADIVSGITKGRIPQRNCLREIPYLAVVNVQDHSLNLSVVKTILATETEIQLLRLICDDLLLTEGGDPDKLGRGTLWNNELPECIHQNHIFRVRLVSSELHPVFLNWLVGSQRGKRYFVRSAKQTTGIASINMTQLRNFPLLLPPIDVQREFAHRIATIEKLKSSYRASLVQMDTLFASLQYRAFRGEL